MQRVPHQHVHKALRKSCEGIGQHMRGYAAEHSRRPTCDNAIQAHGATRYTLAGLQSWRGAALHPSRLAALAAVPYPTAALPASKQQCATPQQACWVLGRRGATPRQASQAPGRSPCWSGRSCAASHGTQPGRCLQHHGEHTSSVGCTLGRPHPGLSRGASCQRQRRSPKTDRAGFERSSWKKQLQYCLQARMGIQNPH